MTEASRYTNNQALVICCNAIPGTAGRVGVLPELPVREQDVQAMRLYLKARYPHLPVEPWE
jgi:hypothetical protein